MKSLGQRKRKVPEVSLEGSKATDSVEKSSAKRNYKRREKPAVKGKTCLPEKDTWEKPSSTSQSAGEELLNKGQSIIEATGIQELKLQRDTHTSKKFKLQLFPVNSSTRLKLEKDGHNPFLELTLSLQKKISSIIKHLNTKWGGSHAALGELMLFPYDVKLESINSCSRWTSYCSGLTAGEVHAALESPAVFRLRYGWVSDLHLESSGISCTSNAVEEEQSESKNIGTECVTFSKMTCGEMNQVNIASQEIRNLTNLNEAEDVATTKQMAPHLPVDDVNARSVVPWDDSLTGLSIGGLLSEASLLYKIKNSTQRSESKSNLQPIELVSDISIGALLSEASLLDKINNPEKRSENKSSFLLTQSVSDMCTGGILCNTSSQRKNDNPDLKKENDAGCHPIDIASEISIGGLLSEASLDRNINDLDLTSSKNTLGLKSTVEKGAMQSLFPWDDCSISLSIGGLLSEASLQARFDGCDPKSKECTSRLHCRLPSVDSSEGSVAAQHNQHTPVPKQPLHNSFSSILDAEETCHAFSFKKISSLSKDSKTSNGEML